MTFKILLSVCMVYIAYNPRDIKRLLKQLILFYLTSFTFGGVAFALLYFVKPQNILIKNGVLVGTYPLKIVLTGAIIGFIIITIAFKSIKKKLTKKDMFCNITIEFEGRFKTLRAMIDTGNLLKEPLSGNPVVVIEKQELIDVVPIKILEVTEKIVAGQYDLNLSEYASRFRVIPFTSLGKENGLLLGLKIDNLHFEYDEQEKIVKNVIVGIYNNRLSKNNTYNALIGLDIINDERGEKHEYITNIKK